MKTLATYLLGIVMICYAQLSFSQSSPSDEPIGAVAKQESYNALYILNTSDTKRIEGALRNIKNVLEDPRLKDKLHVELIVYSSGVEALKKTGPYKDTLQALVDKGVVILQCENTIRQRKIEKSELFDFVNYVPTANGEIILRHYDGWAIVKP